MPPGEWLRTSPARWEGPSLVPGDSQCQDARQLPRASAIRAVRDASEVSVTDGVGRCLTIGLPKLGGWARPPRRPELPQLGQSIADVAGEGGGGDGEELRGGGLALGLRRHFGPQQAVIWRASGIVALAAPAAATAPAPEPADPPR